MSKKFEEDNPFVDNQSFENQPSIPLYDKESEKGDLANKGKFLLIEGELPGSSVPSAAV